MSKEFKRVMKGEHINWAKAVYPMYAAVKLDGIRAYVKDGVVLSASSKPIRNLHVQELFGRPEYEGYDGELIVGKPNVPDTYDVTHSAVMRKEGTPDVVLYAFDNIWREHGFDEWYKYHAEFYLNDTIKPLTQVIVHDEEELREAERVWVAMGYEGAVCRSFDSPYKQGKSTANQGWMLKVKSFVDSEAVILDMVELMHNNNEKTTNEMGVSARSHHKENKVGGDTMGTLCVKDRYSGVEFEVGTGYTAAQRQEFWDNKEELLGKIIKYKFFPIGVKNKPRHPVYLGMRDEDDLDD